MWIARNRNNDLMLFVTKPFKDEKSGEWRIDEQIIYLEYFDGLSGQFISLVDHQFDYVKWEDEPIEVKLVEVENKTKQAKDDVEKVCKNCQFYREVPACYDSNGFCKDWKLSTYIINQMKKDKKKKK